MKKKLQIISIGLIILNLQLIIHNSFSQNVGINTDGSTPESGTMLDIKSAGTTSATFGLKVKDSAGDSKLVIRSDGRVGIGTISPDFKLSLYNTGATGGMVIVPDLVSANWRHKLYHNNFSAIYEMANNANVSSIKFDTDGDSYINPFSGNIGIGTTSPTHKLHAVASTTDPSSNLSAITGENTTTLTTNGTNQTFGIRGVGSVNQGSSNATAQLASVGVFGSALATGTSGTVNWANAVLAKVSNTGAGTITNSSAIRALAAANSGGGTIVNAHGLFIDGQTAGTNNWSIYANGSEPAYFGGNIGVGDNSPEAQLEVSANGGSADLLMLSSDDGNDGDVVVVKNSGNVGIATTTPDEALDVVGRISISDFEYDPSTNRQMLLWKVFAGNGTTCQTACGNGVVLVAYADLSNTQVAASATSPNKNCMCAGRP